MPKRTFKEYMNYVGGFGLSYAHSAIKPIASLGDTPPKSHKYGRVGAGVGLYADTKRIPRKPGQKAGSDKHSDLYTDENPKGTIHGLGFKDAATANKGVAIINKAKRTHAHKVQATLVMQQRAKEAIKRTKDPEKKENIQQAYKIWTTHLEKLKAKTKEMNK